MADDEKKPFDAEMGGAEDDHFPDPDETMNVRGATGGNIWLLKIPKYLMERWSRVEAPNSHLATVRVYNNTDKGTRYFLLLPRETPEALGRELTEDDMDIFELDMVKNTVENQFIVAQKPKAGTDPRARIRQTAFIGNVHTECNARPLFSESYQARVRARNQAANTPLRTIQMMEDHVSGGQGAINRLASGVANGRGFSDLVKSKDKNNKQFERMARMPRNQLLDILFNLFRSQSFYPIRLLREKTQQPEAYLKEVLSEIADLHRSGEHAGTYELKAMFQETVKGEGFEMNAAAAALYQKAPKEEEGDDGMDEDEDDDDDDDMEEVA